MSTQGVDVDYMIVGAGAAGMAFADTLLTETNATIAMVDRHHRPGGHWNDAYPFVRLHQPSSTYGGNYRGLGSGRASWVRGRGQGAAAISEADGHFTGLSFLRADWVWAADILLAAGAALIHLPIKESAPAARPRPA